MSSVQENVQKKVSDAKEGLTTVAGVITQVHFYLGYSFKLLRFLLKFQRDVALVRSEQYAHQVVINNNLNIGLLELFNLSFCY